jgi:hypothetical protein
MKGCEFFDQLSESYCQILNDCALWSLLELHVPTKLLYSLSITICTLATSYGKLVETLYFFDVSTLFNSSLRP